MANFKLIAGSTGHYYTYTIILVMLVMMLAISIRLLIGHRKKAYFSTTVSLLILIVHYLLLFRMESGTAASPVFTYLSLLLKTVSYLLINLGIYQLYNRTRVKHYLLVFGLFVVAAAVSLTYFYTPGLIFASAAEEQEHWRGIGLELYMFVLIFLSLYLVVPFIGQTVKFQISVTIYFCAQISHLLNVYLFKGIQPVLSFLEYDLPVLFYFLMFLILFERVLELMQAMYRSSVTDGLTGLYNRKFVYNRLARYLHRGIPVSVIFADIDNFKLLNDTEGHQVGDEVLRQVARIMREETEDFGYAGRYGGEEMVALIMEEDAKADKIAEKIRRRVEQETMVTLSIGFSKYKEKLSAEELIKRADEAMYTAKTTGKNRVVPYAKSRKSPALVSL